MIPGGRSRTVPDDAFVMDMRSRDGRDVVCPGCGRRGSLLYVGSVYEKGMYTDVYECFGPVGRGGTCGCTVFDPHEDEDVMWVSPNGLWAVVFDHVTDIGTVNVLVMNEGSQSRRYTLHPDGSLSRDGYDVPGYVDHAATQVLRSLAGRYRPILKGVIP